MQKTTLFEFSHYTTDFLNRNITFVYTVYFEDGTYEKFIEVLELPTKVLENKAYTPLIEKILQTIHLALGISYYKLFCSPKITILSYEIDKKQADFWDTVYTKGLGQFYFVHKIDFRGLVQFPYSTHVKQSSQRITLNPSKVLIPFGGGKDSILTLQQLRSLKKFETQGYILKKNKMLSTIADRHKITPLVVGRTLDPKIFTFSKNNVDNKDHVPITLIISFISLLLAVLYDFGNVIIANERSAEEGNTAYLGMDINHQWSKSLECERMIQEYIEKNLMHCVTYFSLVRGLYDIEIVRRFVEEGLHKKLFTSCNAHFTFHETNKSNLWCGKCPKCAYSFALFSAFLPASELQKIFGSNFFEKKELIQTYKDLLGIGVMKPFECVGTPDEVQVAFYRAYKRGELQNTNAMKLFLSEVLPTIDTIDTLEKKVFEKQRISVPLAFQSLTL